MAIAQRDVQCWRVMSLVAISVRVTVAIPSQPQIISHTYSSTPCQIIPDRQSYSDNPWSTTDCQTLSSEMILASFDVVSLFTNLPADPAVSVASERLKAVRALSK